MRSPLSRLSIRVKIIFLVAAVLISSLAAYLYSSTGLMVQDKASYIYDFNLTQSRLQALQLEKKLGDMANLAFAGANVDQLHSLGLTGGGYVLDFSASTAEQQVRKILGSPPQEVGDVLISQNWKEEQLGTGQPLFGQPLSGSDLTPILITGETPTGRVRLLAFVSISKFLSDSSDANSEYVYQVFKKDGTTLLNTPKFQAIAALSNWTAFTQETFSNALAAGAKEWIVGNETWILGYQRFLGDQLLLTTMVPKRTAFEASELLFRKSLIIGVSILSIALAFALLLARGIIGPIRQLWAATLKVSEGDFNVQIDTSRMSGDELGDLAESFNGMTGKIQELLEKTAEKARMESELQTARYVQESFFPRQDYSANGVEVAGTFVPATECGGDWWHVASKNKTTYCLLGDVTGHGVSAALVTATVFGAYNSMMGAKSLGEVGAEHLNYLVSSLNGAVRRSGRGEASMSMLAASISAAGKMSICNASHRNPIIGQFSDPASLKPLVLERSNALGDGNDYTASLTEVEMRKGDVQFWFTDGLIEIENQEGKPLGSKGLVRMLSEVLAENAHQPTARNYCDGVMNKFEEWLGRAPVGLEDDITLVVILKKS
jgi:sigma-B regulation protein RsbU (phosphoserine phosphatase)